MEAKPEKKLWNNYTIPVNHNKNKLHYFFKIMVSTENKKLPHLKRGGNKTWVRTAEL